MYVSEWPGLTSVSYKRETNTEQTVFLHLSSVVMVGKVFDSEGPPGGRALCFGENDAYDFQSLFFL